METMKVEMYTQENCKYCDKAKEYLNSRNIPFTEKYLDKDISREDFKRDIQSTTPAIFINDILIGGYDDLVFLAYIDNRFIMDYNV